MRIFLAIVLLITLGAQAEIYKTHDKDGHVVYTDKPKMDNAEIIQLKETNTVPGAEPLPNSTPINGYKTQAANVQYQINIISPKSNVTIPPGQRDLAIAVQLYPPLNQDHLLVYFMDGELLQESQLNNIVVKDAPRGGHTLVVEAIDRNGQSLGTSAPVIVNIIRPTIIKPASPKPKAN
jgi:hypothetical protein